MAGTSTNPDAKPVIKRVKLTIIID